jgi:hypothetical protein
LELNICGYIKNFWNNWATELMQEMGPVRRSLQKQGFLEILVEMTSRFTICVRYLARNVLEMAADSEEMTSNTRY